MRVAYSTVTIPIHVILLTLSPRATYVGAHAHQRRLSPIFCFFFRLISQYFAIVYYTLLEYSTLVHYSTVGII